MVDRRVVPRERIDVDERHARRGATSVGDVCRRPLQRVKAGADGRRTHRRDRRVGCGAELGVVAQGDG